MISRVFVARSCRRSLAFPNHGPLYKSWLSICKPATEICMDISSKSPIIRQKILIPVGNGLANMDHQISARLEKDPARRKMFMNSSINLTDKSATEKGSNFFGQLLTFLVAYNLISGFLHYLYYNIIYYNPDIDPKNASSAVSNELLDLNREIMAIRQELRLMYLDKNKSSIESQTLTNKISELSNENASLRKELAEVKSTVELMKKQILIS